MSSTLRRPSGNNAAAAANGTTASTGRSSSQISIYDYPEHLNPFHEEDNHKRLRFWRMTTPSKNRDGTGGRDRSNSFSLNGLKEMWAFKSFRLKKRSSTLGINKTSESPPQLRRDAHDVHQSPAPPLFDSRIRHTMAANGSTAAMMTTTDDDNGGVDGGFKRGAGYRSSLQNVMHYSNGGGGGSTTSTTLPFNRNDRYRSTIQTTQYAGAGGTMPPAAHHDRHTFTTASSRGSVTPTPMRSSQQPLQLARGLSQVSLNSTNPFDGEDDDFGLEHSGDYGYQRRGGSQQHVNGCDDNVSRMTVDMVSDGAGGVRKVYRKKRRAPPPPPPRTSSVPPSATDRGVPDGNASQSQVPATAITTVPETSRENSTEDDSTSTKNTEDISQLAAQIASFVQTADTDQERLQQRDEPPTKPPTPPTYQTTAIISKTTTTTAAEVHHHHRPSSTCHHVSVVAPVSDDDNADDLTHRSPLPTPPPSPRPQRRAMPASARDSPENNAAYPERLSRTPTPSGDEERAAVPAVTTAAALRRSSPEKQLNTLERNPRIIVRAATADDAEPLPLPAETVAAATTTKTEIVRVYEQPRRQQPTVVHSLHISESSDDLSEPANNAAPVCLKIVEPSDEKKAPATPTTDSERYKIRFVALKPSATTTLTTSATSTASSTATKPEPNPNKPKWTAPWSSGARRRSASAGHNDDDNDTVQLRSSPPRASASSDGDHSSVAQPPATPRRRRSVKDIIESINKCQSLLRINQTDAAGSTAVDKRISSLDQLERTASSPAPPPPPQRNLSELQAGEQQIRQTIHAMETQQRLPNGTTTAADDNDRNNNRSINSNYHNGNSDSHKSAEADAEAAAALLHQLPVMVERYAEFSNEFKKCGTNNGNGNNNNQHTLHPSTSSPVLVRRREKTTSTSSGDRTDWNPLPKPRRSRNLSHEAIEATTTTAPK